MKAPLSQTHPEIVAEFHLTRNCDLTPDKIAAGSTARVWWKCPKGPDYERQRLPTPLIPWKNKEWATRKGPKKGGKPCTWTSLYKLLTNVASVGKVRYKDEVHDGEHAAIVDPGVWQPRSVREIFTKPNGSSIGRVLSRSGPSLLAERRVIGYDICGRSAKCDGREKAMNALKDSRSAWPRRSNSRRC